jgi:hypothetical protein
LENDSKFQLEAINKKAMNVQTKIVFDDADETGILRKSELGTMINLPIMKKIKRALKHLEKAKNSLLPL